MRFEYQLVPVTIFLILAVHSIEELSWARTFVFDELVQLGVFDEDYRCSTSIEFKSEYFTVKL